MLLAVIYEEVELISKWRVAGRTEAQFILHNRSVLNISGLLGYALSFIHTEVVASVLHKFDFYADNFIPEVCKIDSNFSKPRYNSSIAASYASCVLANPHLYTPLLIA